MPALIFRHLYALYCLFQRELSSAASSTGASADGRSSSPESQPMPEIFSDPGYGVLSTSVLSTSNCGNPALRLFGFAEVTPEGYGIGYIVITAQTSSTLADLFLFPASATSSRSLACQSAPRRSTFRHADSSTRSRPFCSTSSE